MAVLNLRSSLILVIKYLCSVLTVKVDLLTCFLKSHLGWFYHTHSVFSLQDEIFQRVIK